MRWFTVMQMMCLGSVICLGKQQMFMDTEHNFSLTNNGDTSRPLEKKEVGRGEMQ